MEQITESTAKYTSAREGVPAALPLYNSYRDSGVEWLGEIPEHWEVKRLKQVATLSYGIGGEIDRSLENGLKIISLPNIDRSGRLDLTDVPNAVVDESEKRHCLLEKGDLLFNWRNGSASHLGKTALFNAEGEYSHVSFLLRVRFSASLFCSAYYYYLINGYRDTGFFLAAKAGVNNTFNLSELSELMVHVPPLPEQRAIADFLDQQTSHIDTLIQKKEHFIQLLEEKRSALISHAVTRGVSELQQSQDAGASQVKFKESGVQWLGEIPEHWEVKRLKFVLSIRTGFAFDSADYTLENGTVPLVRIGDLSVTGTIDLSNAKRLPAHYANDYPNYIVGPGSIVMAMTGATTGKAARYNGAETALLNQRLCIFEADKLFHGFLWYCLIGKAYLDYIDLTAFGGAQPNISDTELAAFSAALPPLPEQRAIADFLDQQTQRIDTLIQKTKSSIELLKEKRSALISAAVTGQIKVPGVN